MFLTGGGGNLSQFIEKSSVFESKRERWGNSRRFALTVVNREGRLHTKADTFIPSPLGEDDTPMTKSNELMT